MSTRRVEEIDTNGRRRATVDEEPATTEREDVEAVGEERVVHSDPWNVARGFARTIGLLALAMLAIVETMLGFRLAFLAAGANPANSFVDFIYDATDWLVEPFGGIVTNEAVEGGGTFESATLIAMIVYAVAALLFVMLLWAITSFPSPAGTRSSVIRTRRSERTAHEH
jgi:hypothetical protein